jgi:hypothetical protein
MNLDVIKSGLIQHSPEILTGLGIAGFTGTVIFAVKATPKAERLIAEANAKTIQDKAKATWKVYLPAFGMGVASAACIIGGATINHKRNIALMTAYAATETAFANYRHSVLEQVPKEKLEDIKEDFKERMKERRNDYPSIDKEVYSLKKPEILCQEEYTGRYFMGRQEDIEKLCVELGRQLNGCYTTMEYNDFLIGAGLNCSEAGSSAGWVSGDRIEPYFVWDEAPDGGPLLKVCFNVGPHSDYKEQF